MIILDRALNDLRHPAEISSRKGCRSTLYSYLWRPDESSIFWGHSLKLEEFSHFWYRRRLELWTNDPRLILRCSSWFCNSFWQVITSNFWKLQFLTLCRWQRSGQISQPRQRSDLKLRLLRDLSYSYIFQIREFWIRHIWWRKSASNMLRSYLSVEPAQRLLFL